MTQDGGRSRAKCAARIAGASPSARSPAPSVRSAAHGARVVAAASGAEAEGVGAYLVDGKMVDRPFVERARAIVAEAGRLRLLPGQPGC